MDHTTLYSRTYKLRAPGITDHAIYFTIVGKKKPVAFFVNSKEMDSFQWIVLAMTSFSKLIKSGMPIESIIKDMKETFQPNGDYIIPDGTGTKVHSVVHHMGLIMENHINSDF